MSPKFEELVGLVIGIFLLSDILFCGIKYGYFRVGNRGRLIVSIKEFPYFYCFLVVVFSLTFLLVLYHFFSLILN